MNTQLQFIPQSENAISVVYGKEISLRNNQVLVAAKNYLQKYPFHGLLEVVLAYNSITIYYDIISVLDAMEEKTSPSKFVTQLLKNLPWKEFDIENSEVYHSEIIEIPVAYGSEDLDELSSILSLSQKQIIDYHTAYIYQVFMVGFLPGFPYLGILPKELEVKRKSKPNLKVQKGSVAIAGRQTGIYPTDSPGGWFTLGRTKVEMFDLSKSKPCFLQSGDRVRFIPI